MSHQPEFISDLNLISNYLAQRDFPNLNKETLLKQGLDGFDLVILFGGAIPAAADVLGELWQAGLVKKIMVVGGIGHTTDHLQAAFQSKIANQPEAILFADYLTATYHVPVDSLLLETMSTNCGENVQFALDTLLASDYSPKQTLIMQDAAMQRRMGATFAKIWPTKLTQIYSYAPYLPLFSQSQDSLKLEPTIWGMWEPKRYIELILGEIPRLKDDLQGYGPQGKQFIAHVDIPEKVLRAFERLAHQFPKLVRKAYQSPNKDA
ncbi:YdcF family protein [Vagococcus sp. BWB3-3]|uniref:YdcF family protein n=1 Tax=Vagococcus allomyrinae TaxID=2794353 RepID=A0A940SWQ8_9ENTE|nr:YdcF family protein [Vagococcus allomyrinae]MBP1041608.1 YdcF family protein [Vagococcus allomyrinae]